MSYSVYKNVITLTRGDSFSAKVSILDEKGEPYLPKDGDRIRFAAKKTYEDRSPLIQKEIPLDTLLLTLDPEDTKSLSFGQYVYDIQLEKETGEVDTFLPNGTLHLTEEVD